MIDPKRKNIVLLVEDSPDHAFLIKRAISAAIQDLKIQWAKDGEEAVEFVIKRGLKPDLILLDIKMPRMNGFEVLRILKGNKETRYIPIVILSTSANEKDVSRAYTLGTNCYITKPVEIAEFQSKLKSIPLYWLRTNTIPF
ncbi:MAG: response regulator [Candidatus Hodarchaeales archaeon]|jgi:CheY-like chemotaxis protein